jgi:serine/threonine protein kinase
MEDDVKREIAIMKLLKHENIVKLYEVLEGPENYYLILELITGKGFKTSQFSGGELFEKIGFFLKIFLIFFS